MRTVWKGQERVRDAEMDIREGSRFWSMQDCVPQKGFGGGRVCRLWKEIWILYIAGNN